MAVYLCHEQPDLLELDTQIIESRPGAVLLSRSALHPGGGGQQADQATLQHAGGRCRILDVTQEGALYWHVLDANALIEPGAAHLTVDAARRSVLAQLHTATHIMNALVYRKLEGALVTGAQINGDGTARMDFDLPDVDNNLLRAIEPEINDVIRQAMPVRAVYVCAAEAHETPGLLRSLSVTPPPTADGRYRVIEIGDLDRQACGGTHLSSTGESRPVRMVKIENKGRRNRRIRIALV